MNPYGLEYQQWWKEQKRRCIEGYWAGGKWMPGALYFYVNFWHIEFSEEGSNTKTIGKPFLRDIEWEFFPEFEKARGHSGFVKKNGIMVPEYKNEASGIMLIAGRGPGKSNIFAAIAAHGYTFFPSNEILVTGFETKYTAPTMGKVKIGLNHLPGRITMGTGRKPIVFPPPLSHRRWKDDWGKEIRSGFKYKSDPDTIHGHDSRILPIVFKETHTAANGHRCSVQGFEEIGMHDNLMDSYNSSSENWMDGARQFGTPFLIGTGGDMDKGTIAAEKMFYQPEVYNIRSYVNVYEKSSERIAYFIPGWKGLNQFKDDQGNTDELAAKEYLQKRRIRKKAGNDQAAYFLEIQYQPLIPRESFLRKTGNIFPTDLLEDQLRYLMSTKVLEHLGQKGRLEWNIEGDLDWTPSEDLQALDFPAEGNLDGCIVIYEHPKEDAPPGLYIAGTDPYQQEESEYSESVGVTLIYKRFWHPGEVYDVVVAEYAARPQKHTDHDENVRKLLTYYNAKDLYENQITGLKQYMDYKNCLHLLKEQPDVLNEIAPGMKVNRGYGMHMTKRFKEYGEVMIRKWLLEESEPGKQNVRKLYSIPLIKELIRYTNNGNFDRVIAFILCLYHDLEVHKQIVVAAETEVDDDFLNMGYRRLGNSISWS